MVSLPLFLRIILRYTPAMTDKSNNKAVSFSGEVPEKVKSKQPPTQKYDRKEIQKRLDIENWMDDELKRLYGDEVSTVV